MVSKTQARNVSQKQQEQNTSGFTVAIGTTQVNLVGPVAAGRRVKILKALIESNGGGANARMTLRHNANDLNLVSVANETELQNKPNAQNVVLETTDTLNLHGDNAANNGGAEFDITFLDLPA